MDKYLSTQDKIEYILPGDKVAKWNEHVISSLGITEAKSHLL
jgi:hypothetical protein